MGFLTDPLAWWIEPFTAHESMRLALAAGLLVAVTTSVVGTWVVLRGMSFLGDALAHGVLPGLALAVVLGVDTTVGALVAALAMMGGISAIRSMSPLPEDTSIGVLFVGFLALAVVILSSRSGSYFGDLNRFLFGSISAVTPGDLVRQAVAASIVVVGAVVFYRALLVMTFDEVQARLLGLRPGLAHGVLLVLLAVAIVSSFQVVGNLLVFAFLIAPPAAAVMVVRRVPLIMATAVGLGSISVVVGLLISYHLRSAAGATMALVAVALFLVVLGLQAARRGIAASAGAAASAGTAAGAVGPGRG